MDLCSHVLIQSSQQSVQYLLVQIQKQLLFQKYLQQLHLLQLLTLYRHALAAMLSVCCLLWEPVIKRQTCLYALL